MENESLKNRLQAVKLWCQENKKAALLVMVILGIIGVIVFVLVQKNKTGMNKNINRDGVDQNISQTPIYPTSLPVSEQGYRDRIQKESIDYVKSQKRSDGAYEYISHYEEICKVGADCVYKDARSYMTTNAWTALAYLGKYLSGKDRSYLTLSIEDILKLKSSCEKGEVQCSWVLAQPLKVYEVEPNLDVLAFLKSEGSKLLTTSNPDNLMLLSIEVRELALLYKLTGDNRFLTEAYKRLDLATDRLPKQRMLYQNTSGALARYGCWYALGAVEVAKAVYNIDLINKVGLLLENADLASNMNDVNTALQVQPCIESYFSLQQISKDSKYREKATVLLEKFMDRFYDGKDRQLLFGEGGTVMIAIDAVESPSDNIVNLTDSSYTIYLLSLLKPND